MDGLDTAVISIVRVLESYCTCAWTWLYKVDVTCLLEVYRRLQLSLTELSIRCRVLLQAHNGNAYIAHIYGIHMAYVIS